MPKANWVRTWAAVAASAALLLGVVVMRSIWHSGVSRNSKPTTLVRSHWPQQKTANPPLATRLPRAAESPRTARQQSRERDQSQSGVFVGEARTLLPAGQRWAIDGLISGLQRGELKGEILLRETWNGQIEDLQIPPIEIPALPAVSADEGIR